MEDYLIVYNYTDRNGTGIGNVNFSIDGGITIKTVREIEKRIKNDYLSSESNVVIINIIKLKGEEQ